MTPEAKGEKIEELKEAADPPLAPATREVRAFAAPLAPLRLLRTRACLSALGLSLTGSIQSRDAARIALQMLASRVLGLVTDLVSAEHGSPEAAGAEAARKAKALITKAKKAGGEEARCKSSAPLCSHGVWSPSLRVPSAACRARASLTSALF